MHLRCFFIYTASLLFIVPAMADAQDPVILRTAVNLVDEVIAIEPGWGPKQSFLNVVGPIGTSKRIQMDPENIAKWIKLYNKKQRTDYVFLNRSLIPEQIIVATNRKAESLKKEAQDYILPSQATCRPLANNMFEPDDINFYAQREFLFFNNGLYKFPVYAGKNFIGNKNWTSAKGFMSVKPDYEGLLNGNVSIKFFDDSTNEIVGHYYGEMKNGLPDGYGMSVIRDKACHLGFCRRGFWKAGFFSK